jgi:hypothetical protein
VNRIDNNSYSSAIGGGHGNVIDNNSYRSVIAAGYGNRIDNLSAYSAIGGGYFNRIDNLSAYSAIGGGTGNVISTALYAAIPGGESNLVLGDYGFAAGRQAQARHDGAFVWADSTLFGIASTAPNQFIIKATGGVGINTNTPADGGLVVNGRVIAGGPSAPGLGTEPFTSYGSTSGMRLFDRTSQTPGVNGWVIYPNAEALHFYRDSGGDVMVLQPSNATNLVVMSNGARLTSGGAWTNSSDRNAKTAFEPVDGRQVLQAVAALPISAWQYRSESGARHIGPMAQDFRATFGLGSDDVSISTVDADGVALAAIQGLKAENDDLRAQNTALAARLDRLEQAQPAAAPWPWLALAALSAAAGLGVGLGRKWNGKR